MMSDTKNNNSNVIQLKSREAEKSLEALNRVTGLEWAGHPESLLPNGLIINETEETITPPNYTRRSA